MFERIECTELRERRGAIEVSREERHLLIDIAGRPTTRSWTRGNIERFNAEAIGDATHQRRAVG